MGEIYRWLNGTQLCSQSDPELWFSDLAEEQRSAIAVCQYCPLKSQCLDYALNHAVSGIWGGTKENTRIEMRLKRRMKINPMRPTLGIKFTR